MTAPQLKPSATPTLTGNSFVDSNRQTFDELLTFIDFAEGFDVAFAQVNYPKDIDDLVEALRRSPKCRNIDFVVIDVSDPELRYLKPEIQKKTKHIFQSAFVKHMLFIRGLENSIGMYGDYPPILKDLNFIRDSLVNDVPYPMLICLPDYAINRVIDYAPDLWSWQSGVFRFKSSQFSQDTASIRAFHAQKAISNLNHFERQERIDLLKRFIQDFKPTGTQVDKEDLRVYVKALNQLGRTYSFTGEDKLAENVLKLSLAAVESKAWYPESHFDIEEHLEALNRLGFCKYRRGELQYSKDLLTSALDINKKKFAFQHITSLLYLGHLHSWNEPEKALSLYQESLEISEQIGDRSGKPYSLRFIGRI
ncbi:MAG: tetratricopeptide repeat protein, partial [Cyanobacteria bacterium P01_A01_bin.37]